MRDSRPKKRSLLSRLSIRNHLSLATSFAQWLMGLHRPWVPPHYLLHTGPLFKHKGRNMKHCFRCCVWVKKIFYLFLGWRRKPLDHFWFYGHTWWRWPWYKLKTSPFIEETIDSNLMSWGQRSGCSWSCCGGAQCKILPRPYQRASYLYMKGYLHKNPLQHPDV